MYHQPTKRTQVIRRITVYSVMTAAVVVLVSIFVLMILGYRYNKAEGTIEQGALLQFGTTPSGSVVEVNGRRISGRTPSKLTTPSGSHTVAMWRDGYHTWEKSVEVRSGSVYWLDYARLIPHEIETTPVAEYDQVTSVLASPGRRWLAVKSDPHTPELTIVDLRPDTPDFDSLTIPSGALPDYDEDTADDNKFTIQQWDHSSRHLLLKRTHKSDTDWILIDRQDEGSAISLASLFGIEIDEIYFTGEGRSEVYVRTDDDIRKLNISAETISRPLVREVDEFSIYAEGTIVYTSTKKDSEGVERKVVGYYRDEMEKPVVLLAYEDIDDKPLHVALGTYYSSSYVAVAHGDTVNVYRGRSLPEASNQARNLRRVASYKIDAGNLDWLSVTSGGQHIITQTGDSYTAYDLESRLLHSTTLKGEQDITRRLRWLDSHSIWTDRDGMLRLYEFDGANQRDIVEVVAGYDVTLNPNGRFLYSIGPGEDEGYTLQRSRLILP